MSNNSTNISVPVKGMNTDVHPVNLTEQGYDHSLNSVVEGFDGNGFPLLQNEQSTLPCVNFPSGYQIVGITNIVEQDRKILFLTNPTTGFSQIGEVLGKTDCDDKLTDNDTELGYCDSCGDGYYPEANPLEIQNITGCCEYHTIATASCLNFDINFPVRGIYLLGECGITVFFTDKNNARRYIEFDYINDDPTQLLTVNEDFKLVVGVTPDDCEAPVYGAQIDCNRILLDPTLQIPCLELVDVVSGGSLKAGVYQPVIAFANENGDKRTSYFPAANPVHIFTRDVSFETDYITDRAILFNIDGISITSPFKYYNIAVIKTINNVSSFEFIGTFPINTTSFTYTGNEKSLIKLDAGDIFESKVYYAKAKTVASSGKYLFWAGLEETKKLNIQRIANNVILYWQTTSLPESAYGDPRNAHKFRSLMRDEVYPLGLVLRYKNGEKSSVGHIPGRVATTFDREIVNNNDVSDDNDCTECAESPTSPDQVQVEDPNTATYVPTNPPIILNEDNSNQASTCPTTPVSNPPTPDFNGGFGPSPIVNAGVDQTINYDASIPLNGTATALAGSITSTQWNQLTGPNAVNIANPGLLNTYFDGYVAGTYEFELVANDSLTNIETDRVIFTINIPPNQAPIADPGGDKTITLPTNESFLNGSQSSDDQAIATYVWSQVSGPNTATIASSNSSYTTVSNLIEGVYTFKLVVTDIKGCSSEATTIVYVLADPSQQVPEPVNLLYPINGSVTSSYATVVLDWEDAPYATSYDIYLAEDGDPYTLVGNATDSNFVLTNLNPNTVYNWYVTPKNLAGSAPNTELYYRSFATPVENTNENCEKERWEVYNTASIIGSPHQDYKECEETCWEYGNFGYWESTRRYPNNPEVWGELCNQPIRHHKVPDSLITHIHDGLNGSLDYNRDNIIYPIGIKVDHDSVRAAIAQAVVDGIITEEDQDNIVGYEIVRGNRFGNKSVVAKGILYDMNQYRRKFKGTYFDNQQIYFPNYPYNDLRSNPLVTDDFRNYDDHNIERGADLPFIFSRRYTFHSPDTHFTEPTIGTKLKLETAEYGMSEGYFTVSKRQARQKFLSNTAYTIAFATGIIAALTRTEEKEIKEYTVKGSIVSGMGIASGILGPFLPYQTGTGAAIVGESAIDTIVNLQRAASINAATEVTTRTVQGKTKDWYNPVYLAIKKPLLLPLLPILLLNVVSNFLSVVLHEADIIIRLIESLSPYRDWLIQYNSIGKYNSYKIVPNTGNKIRKISNWRYLKGENSFVSERSETNPNQFSSIKINNWHRESSLYIKYTGVDLPNASVFSGITDQSRFTIEDSDVGETLDKRVNKPISSYYASIKNYLPDQYGSIFNIEYLTTGCVFDINTPNSTCKTVFGGDTFISRFALKRKVPYFLTDTFEMQDGTDFNFAAFPNLGVPRHYYNSTTGVGSEFDNISDLLSLVTPTGIGNFLGRPKSIRDASTNKFFYQNGYIYSYHYGIPYFLVESDINTDLRYAENLTDKAFYPLQGDLDFWLQEENVRLREPNHYLYNSTYSKQNKEHNYTIDPIDFEPGRMCRVAHPNRVIYSNSSNWLSYKANDYYDFPLSSGKLIGIDGIDNDKVLVRSENTTQVFNAYVTLATNAQTIQVGTGGMFQSKPQEYAKTTLGYAGTQHVAILHTEYGHIWVDAKRGQVFNLSGGGLDEISKYGMKNWFKENLPFQITKDFPALLIDDIDNNFKGIGITMAFDKRFNRLLLTKLDYKVLDDTITYDTETKEFKKGSEVVSLKDNKYFCNRSWTISYNFFTKSWTSYHSYLPNYYIDGVDYFSSGLNSDNGSSLWLHNCTNKSYQVFYGKVYPWSIQTITKADINKNFLNSVEFGLDAIRYHKDFDPFYTNNITFNKAIISTQNQNSGLLELEYKTKADLSALTSYPIANTNSTTIRVTNSDGIWRINQFYDLVQSRGNNIPIWKNNCASSDKIINPLAISYQTPDLDKKRIRGEWCKVKLINDKHTNYKMIFKWIVNNSVKNFR